MVEKYLPKPVAVPLMTFDGLEPGNDSGDQAEFERVSAGQTRREGFRGRSEKEGVAALQRLAVVANRDTGQSRIVARFLLGLYNGRGFPFDLTEFRSLDYALFDDCMAVVRMDANPRQEVHTYFKDGDRMFQGWIDFWGWREPPR